MIFNDFEHQIQILEMETFQRYYNHPKWKKANQTESSKGSQWDSTTEDKFLIKITTCDISRTDYKT